MSPRPKNEQTPNFFNKRELRAGIALSLLGAIATPFIINFKSAVDSRMGDKLNLPDYCHSPNLQSENTVIDESKEQNLKLAQALQEAKTCAEIALKWEFGKNVTEKILNPNITTIEELDETVVDIFQSWGKNNNKFYPSISARNQGSVFSARAEEVKNISDVIANYLSTPAQAAASASNLDNPLFYYLSAKLNNAKASASPNATQAINQVLQELNYTRQSLMQNFQTQYSVRVAKMLVEGKSEQLEKEYALVERVVDKADMAVLMKALNREKLDVGIKETTTWSGDEAPVNGYYAKDKPLLAQRLKTHLQMLISTNKNIRFRLMQMLTENNQLTRQSAQAKEADKSKVQPNAERYLTLQEQLKQGATLVNETQSQQLDVFKRSVTEGLGVDRILESPQDVKNDKTISSVWNKEAMRLMALSSYTYMQKDYFLQFLVENDSEAEESMRMNPEKMAKFNTKEEQYDQNWYSGVRGEMEKNKGQLNEVLEQPEKPLSECAIGCVRPLHDPLTRKYVEEMNLGLPSLESLNKELAQLGLGRIETVYLYFLQDIDNVVRPVYTFVYEAVKFSVFVAVEAVKAATTLSAGFTTFVVGPIVLDIVDPFIFNGFLSVELAMSGGFVAKSSGLVSAAKLANMADDLVVLELGPNMVGRKIADDAPGLGAKVERNQLSKAFQDQLSDYELRNGSKIEVIEVKNLGSFMSGRKDISVIDIKNKLNLVTEDTGKSILQVDKAKYNYTKVREKELAQIISDNPKVAESFGFRKGAFEVDGKGVRIADDANAGAIKKAADKLDEVNIPKPSPDSFPCVGTKISSLPTTPNGLLLKVYDRVANLIIEPAEAARVCSEVDVLGLDKNQFKFNEEGKVVPRNTKFIDPNPGSRKPVNWEWSDYTYDIDILEMNLRIYNFNQKTPAEKLKIKSQIETGTMKLSDIPLTSKQKFDLAEARTLFQQKGLSGIKYDKFGRIQFDVIAEAKIDIGYFRKTRSADYDAIEKEYRRVFNKDLPSDVDAHHGYVDGEILIIKRSPHSIYKHTGGFSIFNNP